MEVERSPVGRGSFAYQAGRVWALLGSFGQLAVVLSVPALALGLWAITTTEDGGGELPANSVQQVAVEDGDASASAVAAALYEECVTNVQQLMVEASDAMKAQRTFDAVWSLQRCEGTMVDAKAIKLLETARKAEAEAGRKKVLLEKQRRKREGVRLGMSEQDVLDSSWGRPRKVNRTINLHGTREQWVYDSGYLYFDDGVLTSIQN